MIYKNKKGGEKGWGTPTMDFWCCHGSVVQAQTRYAEYIYFENNEGLVISQYIPSELKWQKSGVKVNLQQDFKAHEYNFDYAGNRWNIKFKIKTDSLVQFALPALDRELLHKLLLKLALALDADIQ